MISILHKGLLSPNQIKFTMGLPFVGYCVHPVIYSTNTLMNGSKGSTINKERKKESLQKCRLRSSFFQEKVHDTPSTQSYAACLLSALGHLKKTMQPLTEIDYINHLQSREREHSILEPIMYVQGWLFLNKFVILTFS